MTSDTEDAARERTVPLDEWQLGEIVHPDDAITLVPGYDPHRDAEGYTFIPERAVRAVEFFHEVLTHVKGKLAGQPFYLQPWQQAVVMNAFGWYEIGSGLRRFRRVFVYVPRKNGKTTLAAGIVNYVLFCDNEPGAEIYSAAAEYKQAALVFDQVKGMVLHEPELKKRVRVYKTFKSIEYEAMNSVYRVISADADTKHGFNTHCAVIDELHAQPTPELVDVLETSTGSRDQPLIVFITTADYARESVCNTKLGYARSVRDGALPDAEFLPVIYEANESDDWTDEAVWRKSNPNYGVSLRRSYMDAECKKAAETPTYQNTFRRLHLNVVTQTETQWINLDSYDQCVIAKDQVPSWESLRNVPCAAGLDLSSTRDLSSLVLFFPTKQNLIWPLFFIPLDNAHAREKKDRVPYTTWAREGWLYMTPGNVVDYDYIRRILSGQPAGDAPLVLPPVIETFDLKGLAFDRWGATQLVTTLKNDGVEVVSFGQGYASMSPAAKEFEKLVVSGQASVVPNPVMRWCVNNVMVEEDAAGNIKPSKAKSRERIDGVVAAIMAVGLASALDLRPRDSLSDVYADDEGLAY